MNFFLLENNFYNDYSNCTEILKKSNRPYAVFLIKLNNLTFAVPVRRHITHKYSIKTIENKGLDFSKAVIINNIQRYISKKHAYINNREYQIIMEQKWKITKKMEDYIKKYKKALKDPSIPANKILYNSSCLQYFHAELGIK